MSVICLCLNPAIDVSCEADRVHPIRKIRTRREQIEAGGGGVNVARVLSRFRVENTLIYMSGGMTGTLLDEELDRAGIQRQRVDIGARTRISFNVYQTDGAQEFRFVPEGPCIEASELQAFFSKIEAHAMTTNDVVVASGSLPRGAPDETYARIADMVTQRGGRFILDSSGPGLSTAVENSRLFLVKPSLGELENLAGAKLDEAGARNTALDLVRRGRAQYVAVSMAQHGAFLASAQGILREPALLVKARSAVGAGDSFLAGMVSRIASGYSMEDAFRFGMAAGAAAVLTTGTELCHLDDVLALYQSTKRDGEAASAMVV